jgi:hypothetical protein
MYLINTKDYYNNKSKIKYNLENSDAINLNEIESVE